MLTSKITSVAEKKGEKVEYHEKSPDNLFFGLPLKGSRYSKTIYFIF